MKEMKIKALLDNIPAVTAFIDAELEALDCPLKAQTQIDVAIDELFSNIARYAYTIEDGDAEVRYAFDQPTRTASITFIDRGVPFDPLAKEDPDVTLTAEERGIGGLGIYLVKKTMDRVEYRREEGCNILTIEKRI